MEIYRQHYELHGSFEVHSERVFGPVLVLRNDCKRLIKESEDIL